MNDKLTRDDILVMEAGREMDALVAERVMEWTWINGRGTAGPSFWETYDRFGGVATFEPSDNLNDAWKIIEKLTPIKFGFGLAIESPPGPYGDWEVQFYNGGAHFAYADSAPLAICRAALLAVMEGA